MTVKTINQWIDIKPSMLGKNFRHNLTKQLESIILKKCTSKHGHVLKLLDIHKINDNYIANSSSDIMVYVTFTIDSFNPADTNDEIITSDVCAIYESGILVDVYNTQKVLIPSSTYLNEYSFENNILVGKTKKIQVGDELNIKISATKYDNHRFSCLGVIV